MRSASILLTMLLAAARLASAQSGDTLRIGLGEAARLAATQNALVEQAEYRTDQARARATMQRSALLPQVAGQVVQSSHTMNTATFGIEFPTAPGEDPLFDPNGEIIGPIRLSDVRGRLSQTLFDWSAIKRVRSANAAVNAATAQQVAAAERAGSSAAMAYVNALRAQQLFESRRADVELAQELVSIARDQLESGIGVRLDVTRAEAQLAVVNAQLVAARNATDRSRLALARALNISPATTIVLTDSIAAPATESVDVDAAIRTAKANRADIAALDAQIKASELQASAVRAERLPILNFVGDDGWIGKSWDHLLHTFDWAVQVSVPVFQGFRTHAREQEAQAQIAELRSRRTDLEQQYGFDVRAAVLDLSAAREQTDAASARLRLAEQELADARERYQSGVAGSADVITASLRLNDARTAYSEALAAYQTARVSLAVAEGTVTELP